VRTADTHTVKIDAGVIAAQQRVADFFYAARVIPAAQQVAAYFDDSFNQAVFA
jgi:ABC-type nitrate/sulfonate/bicarbonate transport system substrate-binding protein